MHIQFIKSFTLFLIILSGLYFTSCSSKTNVVIRPDGFMINGNAVSNDWKMDHFFEVLGRDYREVKNVFYIYDDLGIQVIRNENRGDTTADLTVAQKVYFWYQTGESPEDPKENFKGMVRFDNFTVNRSFNRKQIPFSIPGWRSGRDGDNCYSLTSVKHKVMLCFDTKGRIQLVLITNTLLG